MTNIRSIDLNLLSAFDALYDERSVTRAAKRLALTQPTVSGMLLRLRHMFSDQLFVRSSHGIVATPRAEAVAGPIKELLERAHLLVSASSFSPVKAEGTIKLMASDYIQHAVVTPLIGALRRHAPKLKVLVAPRQELGVTERMARGEIDLYISSRDVSDPDLPSLPLYRDRFVCVARKRHPFNGRRLSLRELCKFDHLLVHPTGRSMWGPADEVLAAIGHKRRVAVAVPTFHMLFELLAADDFVAFVPERILRGRQIEIKKFETGLDIPPIEVVANWHPRVSDDARHVWLRQTLAAVAQQP
ncbi:LysR family transcriptional regulator [Bradyrhizobium sp. CCBAU 53340]|uniref:LysR family transcriptional regulator n=1 Tax=Bradyrhizobium sp. CCBAU 53340 TaxID=1325112 RepID=UPI00188D6237|nr:LysR family transcriptional regulator [Bradyrhizobium sp. CCBAU 53340]QOZ47424.1 LysR family transcriptional regulator [Bradyrhizobium sp. CCBAU 53340]